MDKKVVYGTAAALIVRGPNQKVRLMVPHGKVIVSVCRGLKPSALPLPPGEYEFQVKELQPGANWPILLVLIKAAHVAAWEAMPESKATEVVESSLKIADRGGSVQVGHV